MLKLNQSGLPRQQSENPAGESQTYVISTISSF